LPFNSGLKQTIINLFKPMKRTRTLNWNETIVLKPCICVSQEKIKDIELLFLESIAQGVLLSEAGCRLMKLEKVPQHCVCKETCNSFG
jgi:hypothetical protein